MTDRPVPERPAAGRSGSSAGRSGGGLRDAVVQVLAVVLALTARIPRPARSVRDVADGTRARAGAAGREARGRIAERLPAEWALPTWLRAVTRWIPDGWTTRLRIPSSTVRRRSAGLLAVYLVVFAVLAGRLVQVQVLDAEGYAERGDLQRIRAVDLPAQRGRIIDRNGAVLTTTTDAAAIYTDPAIFDGFVDDGVIDAEAGEMSRRDVAIALAPLLDRSVDELVTTLSSPGRFAYLARQLEWEVGEEVMALDLPGIHRLEEPKRRAPNGGLASSLIGITDIDGNGLEGLEALADTELAGEPGQLQVERAASGNMEIASAARQLEPSVPGTDLVLTIDRDLQAEAELAATEAMLENRADGAAVLVMDARTGEILAAASAPVVSPAGRNGTSRDDRRARYFTDAFEPGSVQKAVTIAAAWEEGLIDEDTVLEVPDSWTSGGKTWTEPFGAHGSLQVGDILERSSNIGTMLIGQELGEDRLDDWLRRFGYGQTTGVGFPGESAGLLLPRDQWSGTSLPTIAIGHGVAVSLVQLASTYQVLANDGVRVQPSILRGTLGPDGQLQPTDAAESRAVVSADTALAVRQRMQRVVDGERGTGKAAAVDGWDVAGKTGTADKPRADGRGYSDQTTAVFAGMAPVDEPELVVAVMVDEPETRYGGTAAAPTFARVMGHALAARDVAPAQPQGDIDDAIDAARGRASQVQAAADARARRAQEATAAAEQAARHVADRQARTQAAGGSADAATEDATGASTGDEGDDT